MNILLFDEHDCDPIDASLLRLTDRRAAHVREVLKLEAGRKIRIGRINGRTGFGELTEVGPAEIQIRVIELCDEPPHQSPIELILALPRPKSLKRTLRAIANLGIKSIHLINSVRVEKPYWTAPVLEPALMREALLDGLSIARDTVVPSVKLHRLFKPFAQDVAPHLVEELAFVAHPGPFKLTVGRKSNSALQRIPVAIGPEGGFSDYEVSLFNDAGFKTLSLGDRIFSVETAVPVIETMIRTVLKSRPE